MSEYRDTHDGVLLPSEEDAGIPIYRPVTDPKVVDFIGGKQEVIIPSGVIATGRYTYVHSIVMLVVADCRTQQLYGKGGCVCYSSNGHEPDERVDNPKNTICRDEDGLPVCPKIGQPEGCREGRSVIFARLPVLEPMYHDLLERRVEAPTWDEAFEGYSLGLLRVPSGSRWGLDDIKKIIMLTRGSLDAYFTTPIRVSAGMVEGATRPFCRLKFEPFSPDMAPMDTRARLIGEFRGLPIAEQFALPTAESETVEA